MLEHILIEKKVSCAHQICGNIPPGPIRYLADVKIPVILNPFVIDYSFETILIHRICWDLNEFCSSGSIRGIAAFYPATLLLTFISGSYGFKRKKKSKFSSFLSIIKHFQQICEVH